MRQNKGLLSGMVYGALAGLLCAPLITANKAVSPLYGGAVYAQGMPTSGGGSGCITANDTAYSDGSAPQIGTPDSSGYASGDLHATGHGSGCYGDSMGVQSEVYATVIYHYDESELWPNDDSSMPLMFSASGAAQQSCPYAYGGANITCTNSYVGTLDLLSMIYGDTPQHSTWTTVTVALQNKATAAHH